MANYNATGKKAIFGEVAQNKTFRLYSWEIEPVKQFIKKLRDKKLKTLILLLFMMLSFLPVQSASFIMNGVDERTIDWDLSELDYSRETNTGDSIYVVYARKKTNLPKEFQHLRNWCGWKEYHIHSGYVECYTRYSNKFLSRFVYNKETKSMTEYKYNGLFKPLTKVADYRPTGKNTFDKYDAQGKLEARFKQEDPLLYWYEYSSDGTLKTKHKTRFLPFAPI